jgi:hypothetical protein
VFQIHGVDEKGKVVLRKTLKRDKVTEFFANLPPCLIGIEACGSAHHWARTLTRLGHTVRLMAGQFVASYRKSGKNDGNDAEAICEAVGRPNMRFVPVKSEEQQAVLMVHRARSLVIENRTAQVNCQFAVCWPNSDSWWRRVSRNCAVNCRISWKMPRTACRPWRGRPWPSCWSNGAIGINGPHSTIARSRSWRRRVSRRGV